MDGGVMSYTTNHSIRADGVRLFTVSCGDKHVDFLAEEIKDLTPDQLHERIVAPALKTLERALAMTHSTSGQK